MQIHLILDPRLSPQRIAELGSLAERHCMAGIWTSSLLGSRDPFLNFVPLAMNTGTIRMGPIAVNPFDLHPTRIAASLLTLNEFAAGRAQIVIGGGGEALAGLGLKPDRRVLAVRECVALLRDAATGKTFDFAGQIYQAAGFACTWATSTPPSIWIGANGPQMLEMAARTADGIMMSDLPAALLADAIRAARRTRDAAALNLPPLQFSNFTAWHVYEDLDAARDEARRWLAYRGLNRRWVCTSFMSDAEFDLIEARMADFYRMAHGGPAVSDLPADLMNRLIDHLSLTARPDDMDHVIEHLRDMKRAGLTQVALRLYQHPEQSIELIGRRVIPALD